MTSQNYVGRELEVFAYAANWKDYWSGLLRDYLTGDVLEPGAGIGTNTPRLKFPKVASWTCVEPDALLAAQMREKFTHNSELADCRIEVGTTETFEQSESFDVVVYIDVLEHIADDKSELQRASHLLRSGGRLIVLAPAYTWLYTSFDRAIGHVRRYEKKTLRECVPIDCRLTEMIYLDSAGLLASAGNRLFLKQSMPTVRQILFWDRYLVPISRLLDSIVLHSFGKSILGIWTKT